MIVNGLLIINRCSMCLDQIEQKFTNGAKIRISSFT